MVLTGILLFVVGAIVGLIVGVWRLGSRSIGTLRIVNSDEEPQPYLFAELNCSIDEFDSKEYVLMKVKKESYTSHE